MMDLNRKGPPPNGTYTPIERRTRLAYDAPSLVEIDATRVQQLDYSYDKQGNITGIERDFEFERYGYDALGRLTEAAKPGGSFQYQYDKLGNRTKQIENERTTNYTYSAEGQGNRLEAVSSEGEGGVETDALTYNKSGSPVNAGNRSYEYNAEQRPVKLYIDGNLKAEYVYNGWGERIKKVIYTGDEKAITYYFYDEQTLTGEANQNGEVTAQYVYHKRQPVAKLEGRNLYAIHTDHLGTPHAATDEDGGLVWAADYTPFGRATVTTQQITLNLRFPGQYEDQESGTHYNYFRDYDPETGRYLTTDPIGFDGGMNLFAYVGVNPLSGIDPLGLQEAPSPDSPPPQSSTDCPACPPIGDPGWVPYDGDPAVFHCNFQGFQENRNPTPNDPIAECFYDENGGLVDENHEYAGCRGTPNQYRSDDFGHIYPDSGGIYENGVEGFNESVRRRNDQLRRRGCYVYRGSLVCD